MKVVKLLFIFLLLIASAKSYGDEIIFKNGDKLTGGILSETASDYIVNADVVGRIAISKSDVSKIVSAKKKIEETKKPPEEKPPAEKNRKLSIGYSQTDGNTSARQLSGEVSLSKKTKDDELSAKYKASISTNEGKTDSRKFYSMARYAYNFGKKHKWYNFYKIEGDQDKFANVYYRIIPSTGVGYWFSDKENWKAMAEAAFGYEYTNYYDSTKDDGQLVAIPRGYIEKKFSNDMKVTQEIIVYPSLEDTTKYRLHSETAFINPIKDNLALKLSVTSDYNSAPPGNTKKTDLKLTSSIDWSF